MTSVTHSGTSGAASGWRQPLICLLLGAATSLLAAGGRWDIPLAAWIAPLLLIRFSRTSRPWIAIPGVIAAAGLQMAAYMVAGAAPFTPIAIVLCLILGLLFGAPYILDRLVGGRLPGPARLLLLPVAWVMIEFAAANLLPVGTALGTRAGILAENLALMQVVSVLGPYAIGFLIALVATAANAVWEEPSRRTLVRYGGGVAAVLAVVAGLGEGRLMRSADARPGPTVRIAGVVPSTALRAPAWAGVTMANWPPSAAAKASVATPEMKAAYARVQQALLADTRAAARSGAKVVQWSETGAPVLEADKPALLAQVAALARAEGIYINAAVGVPFERNETWLFGPDGRQLWHYRKNHPVPGMEPVAPHRGAPPVAATPFGRLSSIICYDADFPALARVQADILLLPGWDWPEMGRFHTMRLARLRAIENGYSLVRVDYQGVSAAFDPYGRVLASQDTLSGAALTMIVDVPTHGVRTLYAMTGDLFAWLCALATLALTAVAVLRPRRSATYAAA